MIRTGFLSIIRNLVQYIQQQVFVIQVLLTACQLYDKYLLLYILYQIPDEGQKPCPKHVEFYSKNKFEKLVHLFSFIRRIYHDARSSECQKQTYVFCALQMYVVCPKSKCTDFLFNYLLDLPEIISYLLRSMTLGKLHRGSNVSSTDHSSTGSHFP